MVDEPKTREGEPKVLVVDDDRFSLEHLIGILAAENYAAEGVMDGPSALAYLAEHTVDAVLLDVSLPGMNGIEVCREIRSRHRNLPVIFVTGLDGREARRAGKDAGADDFLAKPVDEVELCARMRNLLEAKAYHDLREQHASLLAEELDKTRSKLLHLERLATLGTLAAGVGHELNNIATVCVAAIDFIKTEALKGDPPSQEDLDQLEVVSEHIATHARNLLNLGRHRDEKEEWVNLKEVVTSTLAMLGATGRMRGIGFEIQISEPSLSLCVHRVRLEQVLVNLIANAADATRSLRDRVPKISIAAEKDARDRFILVIEDNGVGISEKHLHRMFEPYFTTKSPDQGTGLGLPVVKQILEGYQGRVHIESVEQKGTKVEIELPAERVSCDAFSV